MNDDFNSLSELLSTKLTPPSVDLQQQRREGFRQANASLALEGLVMSAEDLALQERVITGEITTDQAVALLRSKYRPEV